MKTIKLLLAFVLFTVVCVGQKSEHNGVMYHKWGTNHASYSLESDMTVGTTGSVSAKSMSNIDEPGLFTGSWNSPNGTLFVKVNSFDYENASLTGAQIAFDSGEPLDTILNPLVDDIYIAKYFSNYYVILITSVEPDYYYGSSNKGRITFSYKKNLTVGISEKHDNKIRVVSPNPIKDKIQINSSDFDKVCLYDITGKLLIETQESTIDISILPKGIYLLFIESKGIKTCSKLVKE